MALHYEDGTDMDIIMLRQLAAFYRDAIDMTKTRQVEESDFTSNLF
jgi:hypothetical protein